MSEFWVPRLKNELVMALFRLSEGKWKPWKLEKLKKKQLYKMYFDKRRASNVTGTTV